MIKTPILIKPLFGVCYGVYDKYIKQAKKDPPLVVRTQNHGQKIIDPNWVENNCEIIRAVYKIPERPMRLYKIFMDYNPKTEADKMEEFSKQSL